MTHIANAALGRVISEEYSRFKRRDFYLRTHTGGAKKGEDHRES